MKKFFAMLLALCMILALTACGSSVGNLMGGGSGKSVVGTWTGTVNAAEFIANETPEMKNFLKSAPVAITLTLTSDGKYTINTDGTTMIPDFKQALRDYFVDYCKQEGVTVAELETAMQMTLDELIESVFEDMDMSELNETVSGIYTESNGKITFDPGAVNQVEGTWSGDTMSFSIDIGNVTLTRK